MLHLFERIFAANRFAFLAAVIASYISAFFVALILVPGNLFINAWLFYPRDLIMLWITVAFIPFVIIIAIGKATRTSSHGSDSSSEGD